MTSGAVRHIETSFRGQPSYQKGPRRRPRSPHRKASDAWAKLNLRQRRYIEGLAAGKTKLLAALNAGYSRASAENAARIIEGPDVRRAFQAILQQEIGMEQIALRLREGLDAMDTKFFHHKGKVIDTRQVADYEMRLAYLELAVEYGGYCAYASQA